MPFDLENPLPGNCHREIKSPDGRRDTSTMKYYKNHTHPHTQGNNYNNPLKGHGCQNTDMEGLEKGLYFLFLC